MSNGKEKRSKNGNSAKGGSKAGTSSSKAGSGTSRSIHFEDKELEKAYAAAIRKFGDNLKRLTD